MKKLVVSAVALVVFFGSPATLTAETAIYTDKAAWADALDALFYTEGFSDDQLTVGVSYTSSESGHINPAEECYQDVLASGSANEPMTTWTFGSDITAYGGNWTLGGPGGSGNSLLVYIDDEPTAVGVVSNSYNGGFWGFLSDTPVTSVTLIGGSGSNQQNYRLDDMVYAQFPEPVLEGDLDGDGTVGSADLDIVRANWATSVLPGDLSLGDASGDGTVTCTDLDTVRSNWESTVPASVPEPGALLLIALGLAATTMRRGR